MQVENRPSAEPRQELVAAVPGATAPVAITPLTPLDSGSPRRRFGIPGWITLLLSNRYALLGTIVLLIIVLAAIFAPLITPYDPNNIGGDLPSLAPSPDHWFGTNHQGEDIFAQVIYGGRLSLLIGATVGVLGVALAALVGMIAGYIGGWADEVLSTVMNVFLVIPQLPLLIVAGAYLPSKGGVGMIIILTLTGWAWGARVLRAQTLSLRNRDFLESARVRGERRSYIIVAEVLPTMISLIVANFLGAALYSVLTAAGLQFLGLGNPNSISWGTMLYWSQNQQALQTGMPLWSIAPGLCVALLGTSFALMNYAFDEISNPALRPVRRRRVKRTRG